MITITDKARAKILELLAAEGQETLSLRVAIRGRGPTGFNNELSFVEQGDRNDADTVIDMGGFSVLIDAETAPNIGGASLDWVESVYGAGFKIENPNPVWSDPMAVAVQEVIDQRINPGVAGHGGHVTLLDVKEGTAFIALGGGCQGCGMADVTLKQGIEVMIKEAVPAITRIIDSTDHAGGSNPFYQPSKGGQSPLA